MSGGPQHFWLVKLPAFVFEEWATHNGQQQPIAFLEIDKNNVTEGTPAVRLMLKYPVVDLNCLFALWFVPNLQMKLRLNVNQASELPKEYTMIRREKQTPMVVFSEKRSDGTTSLHAPWSLF